MNKVKGLDHWVTAVRAAAMGFNAAGDLLLSMVHNSPGGPLYAAAAYLASDDIFGSSVYQDRWEYMGHAERIDTVYEHIRGFGVESSLGDDFVAHSDRLEDSIYQIEFTADGGDEDVAATEALIEDLATSSEGYMVMVENATRIYDAVDRARDVFVENGGSIR